MTQQTAHMKHRRTNKEQLQQRNHLETLSDKIDVRVQENMPAQSHVPRPKELQLFKSVIRSGQKYVW